MKIKENLYQILKKYLKLQDGDMDETTLFQELGVGSVNAVELTELVNESFNLRLPTSILFEFQNLLELSEYIEGSISESGIHISEQENGRPEADEKAMQEQTKLFEEAKPEKERIAIIGLSCRCAGARNQQDFWEVIANKKECIQKIEEENWVSYLKEHISANPVISYGRMDHIDKFDPLFFNISPVEANAMDPAQRVLLEECYRALQDANCPLERVRGKNVGTIIGTMGTSAPPRDDTHFSMLGSDTSILAARIAYFLDLKGAAIAVNTACSSALAAIDLACSQLLSGSMDMAIAGGINIYTHPKAFISMKNAGMLSATHICKPFAQDADGIVVGDGVGILILKRLSDACRDKDYIYGVIDGIGMNQDGATNGITVPSFQAQYALERDIYKKNGIDVNDIQYIEAHGTATRLGDPVEIQALTQAFREFTDRKQFCAIGSVKANIGHTAAAAGALSLIKVLLSMKHGKMAPSIHYHSPNEQIDFANSPFFVNEELKAWPVNQQGRRVAAVSAFGLSGSNTHLVIEDYDNGNFTSHDDEKENIFAVSSHSKETLREYCAHILEFIAGNSDTAVMNIAYSIMTGREQLKHRFITTYYSKEELLSSMALFVNQESDDCYNDVSKVRTLNLSDTDEGREFIRKLLAHRKLKKLTELWLYGNNLEWELLFIDSKVYKISGLPEYVFRKQRCYVPMDDVAEIEDHSVKKNTSPVMQIKEESENKDSVKDKIRGFFADVLQLSGESLDEADAFIEFGIDSVSGMSIVKRINEEFHMDISFRTLSDYNTLEKLTGYVSSQLKKGDILNDSSEISLHNELSVGQKGIWVVNQMFPKDSAYHIINAFEFKQRLEISVLQKALDEIVRVNKLLSIKVSVKDGEPSLYDTKQMVPIEVINCSNQMKDQVYELIREKAAIPFSLDRAPLLRVYLLETAAEKSILLTVVHHLIFDGKSLMIAMKQLLDLYLSGIQGKPMKLKEPESQYKDFVAWQKNYLTSEAAVKDRDYWMHELKGELPLLNLGGKKSVEGNGIRITKKVSGSLSEDLAVRIAEVSRQFHVSDFVLLVSAFHMMLHKITGQPDFLIGTVLEGRPLKKFENVVGCFMNVAVLRSKTVSDMPYCEYFKQVKETVLDMMEHGNYPFSELVNQLSMIKDRGASPLFNITFILHNWFDMKQTDSGQSQDGSFIQVEHKNDIDQCSMYDLLVEVFVNENRYEISFKYNNCRFDDEMIQELFDYYNSVLEELFNDTTITCDQLLLQKEMPDESINLCNADKCILEEKIVSVYQEVLQVEDIDQDKNFFEMGGNSMKLVKAALKLNSDLQMDLEPAVLFAYPTVHKLAEYLKGDKQVTESGSRSKRRGSQRRELLSRLGSGS